MSNSKPVALVTGASSGIGREFCLQLSGSCERIIAVARREEELTGLAHDIATQCELVPVVADLATLEGVGQSLEILRQKGPVDILVNNAGFGAFGSVAQLPMDVQLDMISLHVIATTRLCRAVIPFMQEAGGGRIINVSSVGAFVPLANNAVYSATKSYLHQFSCALAQELAVSGIAVQSLCPGYTRTGIHDTQTMADFDSSRIPEEMWMSAADVVRQSLDSKSEEILCIPGAINQNMVTHVLQQQVDQLVHQFE